MDPTRKKDDKKDERISIKLSAYEYFLLLNELKDSCRFCNKDATNAKFLFERIASQLNNGMDVVMNIISENK